MSNVIIEPTGTVDSSAAVSSRGGEYPAAKVFASLVGLAGLSVLAAWLFAPATAGAPPDFGDLSDATFVEIRTPGGSVAMSGELRSRVDGLGNVEKDAALIGRDGKQVIGEIEIEVPRRDAADTRSELEVDVVSLEPHSTYHVYVNDRHVATFDTDDRGSIDVEFASVGTAPR